MLSNLVATAVLGLAALATLTTARDSAVAANEIRAVHEATLVRRHASHMHKDSAASRFVRTLRKNKEQSRRSATVEKRLYVGADAKHVEKRQLGGLLGGIQGGLGAVVGNVGSGLAGVAAAIPIQNLGAGAKVSVTPSVQLSAVVTASSVISTVASVASSVASVATSPRAAASSSATLPVAPVYNLLTDIFNCGAIGVTCETSYTGLGVPKCNAGKCTLSCPPNSSLHTIGTLKYCN
ncbi:hypothetical protein RQP46_002416 [Phenoliferia psychrophenolica]